MAKVKCLINLKENGEFVFNNEYFFGIKIQNKISYKENEIMVTIFMYDNKIIMKRVGKDYEINLEFVEKTNTTGKYFINNSNLWLPLDTFTDKILVDDSSIKIEYKLNLDNVPTEFSLEIKYEVIE